MKKLILDLGHRNGEGLAELRKDGLKIDEETILILVEANPRLFFKMYERGLTIQKNTMARVESFCAAAWDENGWVSFQQRAKDPLGAGWGSNVNGIRDAETGEGIVGNSEVPCFDVGSWLAKYCYRNHFRGKIFIKMDIEGSEFKVLKSIIKAWEAGGRPKIAKMWIEFHSRYMKGMTKEHETDLLKRVQRTICAEAENWH